jgi:hypothetical protein
MHSCLVAPEDKEDAKKDAIAAGKQFTEELSKALGLKEEAEAETDEKKVAAGVDIDSDGNVEVEECDETKHHGMPQINSMQQTVTTIQGHHVTSALGTVHHFTGIHVPCDVVLFLVAGHEAITFKMPFLIMGSVTMMTMLYGCLYLSKLQFIHSPEQLIIQHGVFHRTSD